jgi:hypothetical protein
MPIRNYLLCIFAVFAISSLADPVPLFKVAGVLDETALTVGTMPNEDETPRHESLMLRFAANPFQSSQGIPASPIPELEFRGFERDFGYYIVQFSVPLDNSVREKIIDLAKETPLGAQSFGYIPDNAIVYRLAKKYLDTIRALPEVRWVGPLEPQFRALHQLFIDPGEPDEDGRVELIIQIFHNDDHEALAGILEEMGAELVDVTRGFQSEYIVLKCKPEAVSKIASVAAHFEGTEWVERKYPNKLFNDWSRWITQSYNFTGMYSGSRLYAQMSVDLAHVPIYRRGLYGQGQLVGYLDSGLDTNSIFFCDPGVTVPKYTGWTPPTDTGHRKIRAYNRGSTTTGDFDDIDNTMGGHGTHVGGSIAGENRTNSPTSGTYDIGDGMAPLARLVFTDGALGTSGIYTPSDMHTLFNYARNCGARLHSNSYGSSSPTYYNTSARQCDLFMWNYKDFLIFFAAGNDNTPPGVARVASYGVAKNMATIGATETGFGYNSSTYSNPGSTAGNNPENMAEFSSHGPSDEGIRKPNFAVPGGWYIWSADNIDGGSSCHTGVTYMGGTSMACPTSAGMAALVREYFIRGFYPSGAETPADAMTPSGSLTKAMLIAGTRNMTGSYTIDATDNTGHQDAPSMGQGWGRVVLDDAMYFNDGYGTDTRNLLVYDISPGFSLTGTHTYVVNCGSSTTESFKVVLSYSDYPSTVGAYAIVNNLNLEVQVDANSYKGNVFASSGSRSVTGGSYDAINPDEVVWLDGSTVASKQVIVNVHCTSVPYGGQSYALVIVGDLSPNEPNLVYYNHEIDDNAGGDNDGYAEKNETITMPIWLENLTGSAPATSVTATVSESSPYITFTDNSLNWPDIAPGANQRSNVDHCKFTVANDDATCGHVATITINWSADGGTYTGSDNFDIILGCPAPELEYAAHVIDDGAGGDGDGYPEPGESIRMPVSLTHVDGANAQDVSATLSTSDPYINITDATANWPNIAISGTEQSLADHFAFTVLPGCPEGRDVTFTLNWSCYCGSGSEDFIITIGGPKPRLVYVPPAGLNDAVGGDGDGYPEPGETVVMSVNLRNDGTENATSVRGRISESDPYISITDNYAQWPNIAIGATQTSLANHFAFSIGATTPCGHVVEFTLIDTCNTDRVDTNLISVTIQSPNADLSVDGFSIDDGTGGDGDGIPEAGETFRMAVTLANNITSNAHSISGTISSFDPYITIIDNTADWPDIAGLGSAISFAPHFTIQADPLTPYLHEATITLNWTSWCGSASEAILLTIGDPSDVAPEAPELVRPFPFERIGDGAGSTEPRLSWFVPSDADGDALNFEVRFGTNASMVGATDVESISDDSGFSPSPPVAEGSGSAGYDVNSQGEGALTDGSTYWWDARAYDGNRWGAYSSSRSFTIDTDKTQPDWHQTTDAQFQTGSITNLTVESDRVISGQGINIIFEDDFEGYSSQAEFEAEWYTPTTNYSNCSYSWSTLAAYSPTHSIRIYDASTSRRACIGHTFSPMTEGFISVRSGLSTTSQGEILRLSNGDWGTRRAQLYYRDGYVAYWNGTTRYSLQPILVGYWQHFRIDFNSSANEIYVTINDTSVYGPFTYEGSPTAIDRFTSGEYTATSQYTGTYYFDDYLVGQEGGASDGVIISEPIILGWNEGFTAWEAAEWAQGTGDSVVVVCDQRSGGAWTPFDSATTSGTIGTLDLSGLGSTDTIRLRGKLSTSGGNQAELFDWSVSWAFGSLGIEVRKGGPGGPFYNSSTWDIGQLDEGASVIMNSGESAYIKNTGSVPIDIRLKAETPNWTLANSAGADEILLMGLFDLESSPPIAIDFTSPTDVLTQVFKLSGGTDPEPFATDASNGVNVSIGAGRFLYIYFGAPTSNTFPSQQTITITVEAQSSM